ncbi:hypothetical protein [uncultured Helicobacter sp.]|uniref:hypothetical protein n=1 Tax=uncultured Helicobacter sp. TaxID=175537 RepID=UPI00374ED390
MQINNTINTPFLSSSYATQNDPTAQHQKAEDTNQNQTLATTEDKSTSRTKDSKDLQSITATQDITQNQAQDSQNTDENLHPNRITYGLKILELMSDEEYRAFVFASQGLSESQKMLMAQGLYRFTDLYQGRKDMESAQIDATTQHQLKAFGVQNSQIESFIKRYKNAYEQIMQGDYLG